jgi:hypothetical protein
MTGTDHAHSESVVTAAQWLAAERQPIHPIIPELRRRFGLTAVEACEATALAQKFRVCRRAFG